MRISAVSSFVVVILLLVGCSSSRSGTVDVRCCGEVGERLAGEVKQVAVQIPPVQTAGVVIGFEGLLSNNMRTYLPDLQKQYAPNLVTLMAVDDHAKTLVLAEQAWSHGEKVVVMSFSNSNSFFGVGGRNSFLEELEARKIKVEPLVLFDNTWGGVVPGNVMGVINVFTGDTFTGKEITPLQLRNPKTWVINVHPAGLNHLRLPLPVGAPQNEYEESVRKLYTALITKALNRRELPPAMLANSQSK